MFRFILILFCLFLCSKSQAEETRLTVPLNWKHLPRKSKDTEVYMKAKVPGADVYYQTSRNGLQIFSIYWENSAAGCSASAPKRSILGLTCSFETGYYQLIRLPGKNAGLEWVSEIDSLKVEKY